MTYIGRIIIFSSFIFCISLFVTVINAQTTCNRLRSIPQGSYGEGEPVIPFPFSVSNINSSVTATIGDFDTCDELCDYEWNYFIDDVTREDPTEQFVMIYENGVCQWGLIFQQSNVPPTAMIQAQVFNDATSGIVTISLVEIYEPSAIDRESLTYEFDCGIAGIGFIISPNPTYTCPVFTSEGVFTVQARITDKDGGRNIYSTEVAVFFIPDIPTVTTTPTPAGTEPVDPPAAGTEPVNPPANETEFVDQPISNDTDGDGMPDEDDSCSWRGNEGGLGIDENGCPYYDADWDGIYDRNDACPWRGDEYGQGIDSSGCPIQAQNSPQESVVTQEPSITEESAPQEVPQTEESDVTEESQQP